MAGVAGRSGRLPIPMAVAEARGSIIQNPSRFSGRADSETAMDQIPLGLVPPHFQGYELLVNLWGEFTREYPWLRESDRKIVELACLLMWDVRSSFQLMIEPTSGRNGSETRSTGMAPNATFSQLRQILSLIGGTPSTFHKVFAPKPKDEKEPQKKGSRYSQKIALVA